MIVKIILFMVLLTTVFLFNKKTPFSDKNKKDILGVDKSFQVKTTQPENNITADTINQAQQVVDKAVKTTQDTVGSVLSEAATKVSSVVIENAVGSLMKQIDKLPPSQKEEIKNTICK